MAAQKPFQDIVIEYLKKDVALLKSYKIGRSVTVVFPNSRKIPLLGKLGMWITRLAGGEVNTSFADLRNKK